MNLPKYPEYVESGVEWLGRAPMHWASAPLKVIATCNDEVLPESTASNRHLNYVEISDVSSSEGLKTYTSMRFSDAPSRARRVVRCGDILISTVRTYLKAITSIQGNAEDFIASTGFAVIRPKNNYIISNYLSKVVLAGGFIGEIISRSVGVSYPAINASDIMNLKVPLPPQIEQIKIAQFLDYETAKIDALIDEQKRLIELLKEKRQAVISHAVTKGLNPDAPMKDSGVEWLGKVPEHWVAGKIKHLAKVISKGTTPSTLGGDFEDKGVRFIKAENVGKSISVSTSPEFFISEEVDELLKRSRLQESDVLVIIAGATTGKASVITDELLPANTNQAVSFIRPTSSIYSKWIALSMGLSSTQNEIQLTSVQSAQPNLSMEDLGNLSILIPPQSEVSDIIRYLEKSTKKIDILMAESERLMKLQVERRSALISAAVTGKIDVRDWQPPEDADLIDSNAAVQMERQDG